MVSSWQVILICWIRHCAGLYIHLPAGEHCPKAVQDTNSVPHTTQMVLSPPLCRCGLWYKVLSHWQLHYQEGLFHTLYLWIHKISSQPFIYTLSGWVVTHWHWLRVYFYSVCQKKGLYCLSLAFWKARCCTWKKRVGSHPSLRLLPLISLVIRPW